MNSAYHGTMNGAIRSRQRGHVDIAATQTAVAAFVLVQVLLVIVFSEVEGRSVDDLRRDLTELLGAQRFLVLVTCLLRQALLLVRERVDARPATAKNV